MPRRWVAAVACLAALVALACEGGQAAPRPSRDAPRPGLPGAMAALGDSITAGFGSCLVLTECQRNSWSTGDGLRVDSHYQRLRELDPALRGRARNHAAPGARAAALAGQAEAAVRDRADYVTVLIGANDACRGGIDQMTPVGTFRDQVDRGLRVLRKGRPKARVLVVSIPDLNRLWQIGHAEPRAVRAWRYGVCPALLADPTSTAPAAAARRAAFRQRIDAYNAQLRAACKAYGSRCRYDGGAVHRVRFSLDLVNRLDWFHPNAAGQRRLAEVTWPTAGYVD
ncbi:GDSL-type esterase/lipase family protein [Micromonospora sp. NPDC050686]|uniref:GDSL-type esterase/lipase family protein n=1 Tax=Micromonospora sp. NPDC050686 TaxID=3154631 RepID=UPI0033EB7E4C